MKTPPPIMPSASAESSISDASSGRMSAITYISIPSVIQPTPAMMSSRHWYVPNWAAAKARSMAGSSMGARRNFWLAACSCSRNSCQRSGRKSLPK